MLSIYNPVAPVADRIHYLKHYETYDGVAINQKMFQLLTEKKAKVLEKIIDVILHTRNIDSGRGLRDLTYSYLYTLQQFVPMKTVFTLYMMVKQKIGSWRDVRAYCEFLAQENGQDDPFIKPIICLYNDQISKDNKIWKTVMKDWREEIMPKPEAREFISYAAKWVPREAKGRRWLFDILVSLYNDPEYTAIRESAKTPEQQEAAERKCKMMYRKMVSNLNKELDTLEIKQCANEWATIDPNKLSTSQLYDGANTFTNKDTKDRAECASTFEAEYKRRLEQIALKKYSYNVPVWKLVKHIVRLTREKKTEELNAMNLHWRSYVETRLSKDSDYYIPMLDISESMSEKELYTAIGMCCLFASKSLFGQKVLVFSHTLEWVDLTGCEFDLMVQRIMSPFWSKCASVNDACEVVLNAVLSADMSPEDVEKLKIQLYTNREVDYETIIETWSQAGIKKCGTPFILNHQNFEKIALLNI
jgi:hypothetical protein